MADNAYTFRVVYDHFPGIIKGMERKAAMVVAKTAMDIQAGAQVRAPVRTGYLRGSVQATRITATRWRVTVGADYGLYIEMGTRHMAARPFFHPSVSQARGPFLQALKGVLKP